jgi:hypothetical protein
MKFSRFACAFALALSASAQAAPVTYEFGGYIDASGISGFDVNTPVSGTMTWDTDALPANGPVSLDSGVQFANYVVEAPGAFTMSVAGVEIATSQVVVTLLDTSSPEAGSEGLAIFANAVSINGEATESAMVQISLETPGTKDTLGIALPGSVSYADFLSPDFMPSGNFATSIDSDALSFNFQLTSFKPMTTAAEVPEVSTAVGMSIGFLAMAGLVGRQRRKQAAR